MAKTKKPRPVHPAIAAFASNLRARRLELGLTQAVLAEEAGVCIAYLSLLERGGRNPPLRRVAELAAALGVTTVYLVREAA